MTHLKHINNSTFLTKVTKSLIVSPFSYYNALLLSRRTWLPLLFEERINGEAKTGRVICGYGAL